MKALTGFLLGLSVLLAAPLPAGAQDLTDSLFVPVYRARDAAAAVDAEHLSPQAWERASRALQAAESDFSSGADLARIHERIASAREDFSQATAAAGFAAKQLASLIELREKARDVDAYLHAPDSWKRGESKFHAAASELEAADLDRARQRIEEAEEAYRDAELAAIKAGYLLTARSLLAQADSARAGRYAPKTMARARELVARADAELTENRYDADLPRSLALEANYEARHALHLGNYINGLRREKADWEEIILRWEASLNRIAATAELAVAFDEGTDPSVETIVDYIQRQRADRRRLELEVAERNEQIYAMQEELTRLEDKLGGVSEERLALSRRLEEQAEIRRRFERVEGLFTPEEGEVLRSGQNVILRMTGLQFATGKSEIAPEHAELLARIISAIGEFPGARIVVEGNTDSHGSDALNDRLSTDRARSVRKYLLANTELSPARVDSAGYGESRPIASNDSREGRARNRRIDIVIQTQKNAG